jgi:Raf kinase inhibitor-like YbhB/YbcL family protein
MIMLGTVTRLVAAIGAFAIAGAAQSQPTLQVRLSGLTPNGDLPVSAAFCLPKTMPNIKHDISPGLRWSPGPAGTGSYAIIMFDPDVVTNLSLMNKPGVIIPITAPRMNIYHWELVDIPARVHQLAAGAGSDGFVPGGKPVGMTPYGITGSNDYWPYFNKNPKMPAAMKGPYGGYDGPCPPGNDALVHDYVFKVYALDVKTLGLSGQFFAPAVLKAMQGHVLAEGEAKAAFSFQ